MIHPATLLQETMSGRSNPEIGMAVPVGPVVNRFATGSGVAGDLVVRPASLAEQATRDVKELSAPVVIHRRVGPVIDQALQPCPRLDRQAVDREMVNAQRQGARELLLPRGDALSWGGEDQVEAHGRDPGVSRDSDGLSGPSGVVAPIEVLESLIEERLNSEREPIDPHLHIGRQALLIGVLGVELEGDLGVVDEPVLSSSALDD